MFDFKREDLKELRVSRHNHMQDTVVKVGQWELGGKNFQLIAGPCSVESQEQICDLAEFIKNQGVKILRGGAFKPRTSPYSFQGMGAEGLCFLEKVKEHSDLAVVSEIMDSSQLPLFSQIDLLQVGSRNMQNYELLRALGRQDKPVLLKRGLSASVYDLLMSAEYILAGGNSQVILCERGIRTFETATRNTLDLSAVPVLKKLTHLPVIVDPSHATGLAELVPPMALAAVACGADGVMVEVHNHPEAALCDGEQALNGEQFAELAKAIYEIRPFACKK